MDTHGERTWWKKAKIYELYVDKFAGNFRGLTAHMSYFSDLGVNTLHILPHYPSPMADQGYDVTDYRGVRENLGTLADFINCVEAAHSKNIRIIIDMVLNHVSVEHPWFIAARRSKDNPYRDYFLWGDDTEKFKEVENVFPDMKSSNWIPNPPTGDHYFSSFCPEQADLNWDSPRVQKEILDNMLFWAKLGVDGFRLDAVSHLVKREGSPSIGLPETHAAIKALRAGLEQAYPNAIFLGEVSAPAEEARAYFGNGDECHMVYHFPLMMSFWQSLVASDERHAQETALLSGNIPDNCQWATFLRNHDELALFLLTDTERENIVRSIDPERTYPFNEGTTTSLRLASALHGDTQKILHAFSLLYRLPGAPIMYYGDEIGMTNLPVEEGVRDSRIYVRGMFDWNAARAQQRDPDSLFNQTAAIVKGLVPAEGPAPAKAAAQLHAQ